MKTSTWILCAFLALIGMSFGPFKSNRSELPKNFASTYSFIPASTFTLNDKAISTAPFYMSTCEVTNADYKLFLSETNLKGDKLKAIQVDSNQWRDAFSYNEPYVQYYFSHPAYSSYPVVNVSYEGALEYCKWLSTKINQSIQTDGSYVECRLPSREEWLRAATNANAQMMYAWGGSYLENKKGLSLCNFAHVGDQGIHYDQETATYQVIRGDHLGVAADLSDNADITAPVFAYAPSALGLYNLNGNVAEMVAEKGIAVGGSWKSTGYDVRNESVMNYAGPNPLVGFRPVVIITHR